uniref:Cilia- and flagella-associated protein 36 n=1 Tax=Phaeomonas parva TaxID=124430 RepID=A0A7S1U8T2_9STRA|mmetsp:Transcript_36472/g.114333  ORF Transcript_36472/g.114333 Transcript_36472/m.114333 type:complete len:181 (+) Transcript_36472:33-575(+)|eukprot:CAMPEP_0118861360 /NCGR_PEP_ID=MMETSP1163-20130328/6916_1 /TAXON_ID=124430 /ORGANISM="Phaeomonas parva, Strain CCMP2877" /LENGTH=180 /DNA_ID=CAMNT_0006795167 /DNA_START=4 /DNA_END=546 /DNA_ORIENTATION=+
MSDAKGVEPEAKYDAKDEPEEEPDPEDEDEGDWTETLLEKAVAFYMGRDLKEPLDRFAKDHARAFYDVADLDPDSEAVEHRLEWSELHREYLALFEHHLADFLAENNASEKEFYDECQWARQDMMEPLFSEHRHHWFVDWLLATLEYNHFFKKMQRVAKKQLEEEGDGKLADEEGKDYKK